MKCLILSPQQKRFFGFDVSCYRYLQANDWNLEAATKMLKESILWRTDYFPITAEEVVEESLTGKNYVNGFDRDGRPVLYLKPRNESTPSSERQVKFLVYNLEKAIQLMPKGIHQLIIVIDFEGMSFSKQPSISISRKVISILANHYPERLFKALLVNSPWFFSKTFTLLSPFINQVTRSKICFVDLKSNPNAVCDFIPKDSLEAEYGGDFRFTYHHPVYWEHFTKI